MTTQPLPCLLSADPVGHRTAHGGARAQRSDIAIWCAVAVFAVGGLTLAGGWLQIGWLTRLGTGYGVSLTLLVISAILAGELILAAATARKSDTALLITQRELEGSESRYLSLFEGIPLGLLRMTADRHIVQANAAAAHLFGFDSGDALLGIELGSLVADVRDRERIEKWGTAGEVAPGFETRSRRADGGLFWSRYHVQACRDSDGRIEHFTCSVEDISALHEAQDALKALNATLEEHVQARTAELEALNKELESFAYSVSHDLRAPLRAIDGFSQALLEDYRDKLDAEGQINLKRVRAAAQHMAELIDAMLKLARATRGDLDISTVDLSKIAREVISELKTSAPGRQVAVTIEPGIEVLGDARLLRTVMENLLSNAWKFTSKTPNAHIWIDAQRNGRELNCRVQDNGAGFDMAFADKLFVPFQRLHSASEFPGNGIGLATVNRIVTRLGGRVWAEGAVDAGATFHFSLPLAQASYTA